MVKNALFKRYKQIKVCLQFFGWFFKYSYWDEHEIYKKEKKKKTQKKPKNSHIRMDLMY